MEYIPALSPLRDASILIEVEQKFTMISIFVRTPVCAGLGFSGFTVTQPIPAQYGLLFTGKSVDAQKKWFPRSILEVNHDFHWGPSFRG